MNEHYPFVNPPLPYAYDELEPYIDTRTLYLHHDKILQRYVMNLNDILTYYPELQDLSLEELLSNPDQLPLETRQYIIDNGGGVYNHIIYFNGMTNPSARFRTTYLSPAIIRDFGTVEHFFNEFKRYALSVFGSGYAWLVVDANDKLQIVTTPNESSPIADHLCILAGLDIWEHSYYLQHFNDRGAYIEDWFRVFSWEEADKRLKDCINAD